MPKRIQGRFYALRLPFSSISALLILFSLSFGGWYYYSARLALSDADQIRQRLRDNLLELDSYYARFSTKLFQGPAELTYHVDLWKSGEQLYRMEMTSSFDEGPAKLQVVIADGRQVHIYSQELGEFYPVHEIGVDQLPHLVLEDYWRSLIEAPQINLVAEERGIRRSYYVFEVIPAQPHRDRVREKVWLDTTSMLPARIEIYDLHDRLTQVTVFEMLQLNPVLETTLFQV